MTFMKKEELITTSCCSKNKISKVKPTSTTLLFIRSPNGTTQIAAALSVVSCYGTFHSQANSPICDVDDSSPKIVATANCQSSPPLPSITRKSFLLPSLSTRHQRHISLPKSPDPNIVRIN